MKIIKWLDDHFEEFIMIIRPCQVMFAKRAPEK